MPLHPIDSPTRKYSDQDLDRFLVFCILDRATPYGKVCAAFDVLNKANLTTRDRLRALPTKLIARLLKSVGYRFPNQAAKFLKAFGWNNVDLGTASRAEIAEQVKGVGMKLASMFVRNTRGEKVAVLDVHIRRWLNEKYDLPLKACYAEAEKLFLDHCARNGLDPRKFDLEIWEERRIGNRRN